MKLEVCHRAIIFLLSSKMLVSHPQKLAQAIEKGDSFYISKRKIVIH